MTDVSLKDPEILICLGTREQDVADSSWPEIRKGQRILEDAITKASGDHAEQVRRHVTKIMLRTRASVIRRGCQRVLDLLTQARISTP